MISIESLITDLAGTLDPIEWLKRIDFEPYPWQIFALKALGQGHKRILINGARQVGKSTITAGLPAYISKNEKALSLIYAPSDEQTKDDIERVKEFIYLDDSYPDLEMDSKEHVRLPNGSYIKANTSTARTKRGKSMPRMIIFDEAAFIEDELYKTIRPMLTSNPRCVIIGISTPNGKDGWYYKAWQNPNWLRIMVKAPWDIVDGEIRPAEPEEQFRERMAAQGVHAFYSTRHQDYDFMLDELYEQGELWFRQEYLCEFVEPEDAVFDYDDIERAFSAQSEPLPSGVDEAETEALAVY